MLGTVRDEDGQGASTLSLTVAVEGRGLAPCSRSALCRAEVGIGALALGELSALQPRLCLACHFGELQWGTDLNYNLTCFFFFLNKHLFPEKANPILFFF